MDRRALDAAPIATAIFRDGRFVYLNPATVALVRAPSAEAVLGRHFSEFLAGDDLERVAERHARRLRGEPVPAEYETVLLACDGARVPVQLFAAVEEADAVVQLIDTTQRAAQVERLMALARLGAAVQEERTDEAIFAAVRRGLAALGLRCVLGRPDGDGLRIVFADIGPDQARYEEAIARRLDRLTGPWTDFARRIWRDGAAYADDWALEAMRFVGGPSGEITRSVAIAGGMTRGIGVRVDVGGSPSAILVVMADWLRHADFPAFTLFGTQVSAALAAARTIRDLWARNDELAALNRLAETAATAPGLADFFRRSAEEVHRALGAAGVAVYLVDEKRREIVMAHQTGGDARAFERRPLDAPLAGLVALDGEPRVWHPEDYPEPARSQVRRMGFETVAAVPLRARSTLVGALCVGFAERLPAAGCRIDELQAMAAHFAAAVEVQRLVHDLRERLSELTLVNDVAFASATLDPALLLENALRRILATLEADAGVAYLVDGQTLVRTASMGVSPETERAFARIPADGSASDAARRVAPVRIVRMADAGPRGRFLHEVEGLETAVAVPLQVKGRALGSLVVGRRTPRPFSDPEVGLLGAVGAQLGVAVDNARLLADARRRLSDLEAVNAVALASFATAPGDTAALVESVTGAVGHALGATSVALFLLDEAARVLRLAGGWGEPLPPRGVEVRVSEGSLAAETLRTQSAVSCEDCSRDPRSGMHEMPGAPALALLMVPLTSRRAPRGVLVVSAEQGRRFGEAEVALATALASAVAMGLENAELHAETRRRVEDLSLIDEVGRSIAGSLDLASVLREGAGAVLRLVDASHCLVLLVDANGRELRLGGATGEVADDLWRLRVPLEASALAARAFRERRPVAVEDATAVEGVLAQLVARFGARSLLVAPLLVRDEPVGLVLVLDTARCRAFARAEIDRARAVANQLAVAIENARLYDETRRRAEEQGLLLEVGRSLVATLELKQVLDAGVRNLARIVDAPDAYLFLADAAQEHLEVRAAAGSFPELVGSRTPLRPAKDSLAALVFERREPLVIESGNADAAIPLDALGVAAGTAYLGLPLVVRDRTIGAALIIEPRGPRRFSPAEVDRAAAIANQLAVAAENARLYDDLRRSYADLARAQQQLIHRERLAALGELSAVVAHEVRNPLGVIFNSLGSLRRLLRPQGDAKMLLDIVGEEADRLNRIVGDLLDFARPSTPTLRPEPVQRLIDETVAAALGDNSQGIGVARDIDPALPAVPMDGRLMRQALLNVAVNAVQAMQKGGRLSVRARPDGRGVRIDVQDTGPGIPEEVRHRIFEPFFTTKASGTGLGLAVVKRIVESHGGEVAFTSERGSGTTFSIRLPIEPAPATTPAPAAPPAPARAG